MEMKIFDILKTTLLEKQNKNSLYSIRAFARDLGIGKSTLHDAIYNKKDLSLNLANKILDNLGYGEAEKQDIINYNYFPEKDILFKEISDTEFQKISTCEHFALLSLSKLNNLDATPKNLAKSLNIEKSHAKSILEDLIELKLIIVNDHNKIERTSRSLRTSYDIKSNTIQNFHKETLVKIQNSISEIDVELREIASSTFLMQPEKIKELKEELKKIRRKLVQSVESTHPESTPFLLNFSLIPLSKRSLDV